MRLTKYAHACVRIEHDGGVLVVDPGMFAEPAALDGADAVLVTHEHPDHLDVDAIRAAAKRRPGLAAYGHAAVLEKLADAGVAATPVAVGDSFTAAGVPVRAYGGQHAVIHPDIPRLVNLGYLIDDRVYHPGDSFAVPADSPVDTLFAPIHAPWLKLSEAVDFVRAVAPRRAFALHDGLLNEAGLNFTNANMARLAGCEYARLEPGTVVPD
ncbi:MBL fold metallo-hydrolase [Plantactinospora sp. KBS50]|uniref:MBL fold metallo-hydrolase n=1 Tax=Plantactinospora sp. KBS50 TaxID=2024580 RepID=UPI000BAAB4DE|nr:MBL fold metallo-hydrolase [Plantactinospora sp. KBS50]ASW56713.1 MBL fold metallo-hydrolase [Plantactinospora sp. KBS50]